MDNLENTLGAFSDYLDKEGVEFFCIAHYPETDETYAIVKSTTPILLAAIFKKSDAMYEMFKEAECRSGRGPEYEVTITNPD